MKIACSLCGSDKYFFVKNYSIEMLKKKWIEAFKTNPFHSDIAEINKYQCKECDVYFYNPTEVGNDEFYSSLSSAIDWYYEDDKPEFELAIEVVKKYNINSLFEFGCGSGAFLAKIKNAVESYYGLEINPDAIEKCRKKNITVKQDFQSQKVDAMFSFQVFEHLDSVKAIIEKTLNSLNKNGMLFISVPNPESFIKDFNLNLLDMPPHHQLGFTKKTFEWIAKEFNLDLLEYHTESIRKIHIPWYVNENTSNINLTFKANRFINFFLKRIVNLVNQLARYSFVFYYNLSLRERNKIIGHTHTVIFRKK